MSVRLLQVNPLRVQLELIPEVFVGTEWALRDVARGTDIVSVSLEEVIQPTPLPLLLLIILNKYNYIYMQNEAIKVNLIN